MKRPRLITLVAYVAALCCVGAGCAEAESDGTSQAKFTPGPATQPADIAGLEFGPCTKLELDGYPTNLARPSVDYYQGPWCTRVDTSQVYLWVYARELTPEAAPGTAERDVTLDVEQLTLDLSAQGYLRTCGSVTGGGPIDIGMEKPDSSTQIRVGAFDPPPTGVSLQGGPPPLLMVAVGAATRNPAVPEGLPAPDCPMLGSSQPTVVTDPAGSPRPMTTPQ